MSIYKQVYNILKIPGSPCKGKGRKHSEATIAKLRIAALNRNSEHYHLISTNQANSK